MKTYLVIEKYKPGQVEAIYQRFAEHGRMLPEGVQYVNSWITEDLQLCYQIMRSESLEQINAWMKKWEDLIDFTLIPVISTEQAMQKL